MRILLISAVGAAIAAGCIAQAVTLSELPKKMQQCQVLLDAQKLRLTGEQMGKIAPLARQAQTVLNKGSEERLSLLAESKSELELAAEAAQTGRQLNEETTAALSRLQERVLKAEQLVNTKVDQLVTEALKQLTARQKQEIVVTPEALDQASGFADEVRQVPEAEWEQRSQWLAWRLMGPAMGGMARQMGDFGPGRGGLMMGLPGLGGRRGDRGAEVEMFVVPAPGAQQGQGPGGPGRRGPLTEQERQQRREQMQNDPRMQQWRQVMEDARAEAMQMMNRIRQTPSGGQEELLRDLAQKLTPNDVQEQRLRELMNSLLRNPEAEAVLKAASQRR